MEFSHNLVSFAIAANIAILAIKTVLSRSEDKHLSTEVILCFCMILESFAASRLDVAIVSPVFQLISIAGALLSGLLWICGDRLYSLCPQLSRYERYPIEFGRLWFHVCSKLAAGAPLSAFLS